MLVAPRSHWFDPARQLWLRLLLDYLIDPLVAWLYSQSVCQGLQPARGVSTGTVVQQPSAINSCGVGIESDDLGDSPHMVVELVGTWLLDTMYWEHLIGSRLWDVWMWVESIDPWHQLLVSSYLCSHIVIHHPLT